MANINAELDGYGWNFSGIGVAGFGQGIPTPQFHSNTSDDPQLPPSLPIPKNSSPDRPHLPAVPFPSPPVFVPGDDTLPNTSNTTKGRLSVRSKKCNTASIRQAIVLKAPKPPKGSGSNKQTCSTEETIANDLPTLITTGQEPVAIVMLLVNAQAPVEASGVVV